VPRHLPRQKTPNVYRSQQKKKEEIENDRCSCQLDNASIYKLFAFVYGIGIGI